MIPLSRRVCRLRLRLRPLRRLITRIRFCRRQRQQCRRLRRPLRRSRRRSVVNQSSSSLSSSCLAPFQHHTISEVEIINPLAPQ